MEGQALKGKWDPRTRTIMAPASTLTITCPNINFRQSAISDLTNKITSRSLWSKAEVQGDLTVIAVLTLQPTQPQAGAGAGAAARTSVTPGTVTIATNDAIIELLDELRVKTITAVDHDGKKITCQLTMDAGDEVAAPFMVARIILSETRAPPAVMQTLFNFRSNGGEQVTRTIKATLTSKDVSYGTKTRALSALTAACGILTLQGGTLVNKTEATIRHAIRRKLGPLPNKRKREEAAPPAGEAEAQAQPAAAMVDNAPAGAGAGYAAVAAE